MRAMIMASLSLNILVLVPVCFGLLTNAEWTEPAYGLNSAARRILLSTYIAILTCSCASIAKSVPAMVATLLLVQIIYKATTPFTVGSFGNPVVVSNLAIAAFHGLTVWAIWRDSAS